LTMFAGRMW